MLNNTFEFTKNNIDLYFNELSKEYKKLGGRKTPIEIILIGGAAIIENYCFRSMTTDIDAILPKIGILKEAINHIGDRFSLPNGWLNADFTKTSSYSSLLPLYSKPYKTFNQVLNVRTISGEYLIAMKLKSGRKYKNDLSDIVGILAEEKNNNNPISILAIEKAVVNLYGDWNAIDKDASLFLKNIFKNNKYEDMYSLIRQNEQCAKKALITFDKKYPNVLNDKNVNSIIESSEKSNKNINSIKSSRKQN